MPSRSVLIDGLLSDAKLDELLRIGCELPELDFKSRVDLARTSDVVELAKDIGAMQVLGGYVLVGVGASGRPSGELDEADVRGFDEANLTPRLLKWLPSPLGLRTRLADKDGHRIIIIYVGPHPSGCAFFRADGCCRVGGRDVVAFRAGDVYWRDGTRSVRMSQAGLEMVVERRIARARAEWLAEQAKQESLSEALQRLLAEGERIRASATPTLEGTCALFEVWEHQLVSDLETHGRHDLASRMTAPVPSDGLRGLWSGRWAAQARLDRMLRELSNLIPTATETSGGAPADAR